MELLWVTCPTCVRLEQVVSSTLWRQELRCGHILTPPQKASEQAILRGGPYDGAELEIGDVVAMVPEQEPSQTKPVGIYTRTDDVEKGRRVWRFERLLAQGDGHP